MRQLVVFAAIVLSLAACAGGDEDDRPTIVGAVYPLAWAAGQVAGDAYRIVDVTPPGAEPHDVELSPRDVGTIRGADLVVYVGGGFQPAVEEAVAGRAAPSLDVLGPAGDPHVWLDPVAFASVPLELGRALRRPATGRRLARSLDRLHREYAAGLARCERRTLVTSHAAFGRLAARYGLEDVSLTGLSPEAEPGPRAIEDLVDLVAASGVTTVFTEPLVSDRLAQTVAREAGLDVAVLDPIEGLSQKRLDAGENYLSLMRDNLEALRGALGCR